MCPEFSTTIIDFIYAYRKAIEAGNKYDRVIAHVGLVDFSPRPQGMLNDMFNAKKHKIEYLGLSSDYFCNHLKEDFGYDYFGEKTNNFYDLIFFQEKIIPLLKEIDGLIIIGCNKIILDWAGNYWRKRPQNINLIMDYNEILMREFCGNVVDVSTWNEVDIKTYTVDNIHLNKRGFDRIYSELKKII